MVRLSTLAPLALFLALYWPGLTIWFYQDDFGWLNLRHEVRSVSDLLPALFAPKAHGNLRPWSENGFFLLLSTLFGIEPLPFRLWVFLTQFANLLLLGAIIRRITLSPSCAFWTQILWIANSCVAVAACWTSIYNQFQYIFFLLLAFYLLLRHIETGERRFQIGHWAAFLLGLGSLEVVAVYPALAALYALLYARSHLRRILPMFTVSALYGVLHFWIAPAAKQGPYALHFDAALLGTFWKYWVLGLGPDRLSRFVSLPPWLVIGATVALTLGAGAYVVRRRDPVAGFAVAWFVVLLAPLLPLRDHVTDYYLTGPAIGLALLGARALETVPRASAAFVALYLAASVPAAWLVTRWHHYRGRISEDLVLGVAEVRRREPDRAILLAGVTTDQFFTAIADVAFRALEIQRVYLVPGSEASIQASPDLVSKFILPKGLARRELDAERAAVYEASGPLLRNVTARYRALARANWKAEIPRFINPGDSIFAEFLGPGWHAPFNGYRAMDRQASLRIGGPRKPAERLHVGAFCKAPLTLRIRAVEAALEPARLARCDEISLFGLPLPASLVGKGEIQLSVEVEGAPGATFGFFEIR